ncbi:MAG TPA: class I SAM-dependent methyltransferase [Thermodesulfobacteriota bacterium]|nr:class I SAM-dependent methyltransferase [Thermodesulfobacteriota bacterium]
MKCMQGFRRQFGQPRGFWGSLAGVIMAYTNRERNRWVISLLDIKRSNRVLEIGFGPGLAIELISKTALDGFIAGIDHSEVMIRQASKRNAEAIRVGRVDLRLGSVSNFPQFDEPFDRIISINSIQFWDNPVESLKGLWNMLKPGGLIAIALQPRHPGATEEDVRDAGKEISTFLEKSGFSEIRLETKKMRPVSTVCVIGYKGTGTIMN